MKFVTSFFIFTLIATQSWAHPIKIFYEQDPERAKWVRDIFTATYQIPEDLIDLKKADSCERLQERGKLDLCLNDNGDLLLVSVDSRFINESLKIFRTP